VITDPMTDDWPALDRLVADRVMGWSGRVTASEVLASQGRMGSFSPSTSIAHAWDVVDAMRAAGWDFDLAVSRDHGRGATAWFMRAGCEGRCQAGTVALAICRAALAARDT